MLPSRKSGIIKRRPASFPLFLKLPSHTTQVMQPLDVKIFAGFKKAFLQLLDAGLVLCPGGRARKGSRGWHDPDRVGAGDGFNFNHQGSL